MSNSGGSSSYTTNNSVDGGVWLPAEFTRNIAEWRDNVQGQSQPTVDLIDFSSSRSEGSANSATSPNKATSLVEQAAQSLLSSNEHEINQSPAPSTRSISSSPSFFSLESPTLRPANLENKVIVPADEPEGGISNSIADTPTKPSLEDKSDSPITLRSADGNFDKQSASENNESHDGISIADFFDAASTQDTITTVGTPGLNGGDAVYQQPNSNLVAAPIETSTPMAPPAQFLSGMSQTSSNVSHLHQVNEVSAGFSFTATASVPANRGTEDPAASKVFARNWRTNSPPTSAAFHIPSKPKTGRVNASQLVFVESGGRSELANVVLDLQKLEVSDKNREAAAEEDSISDAFRGPTSLADDSASQETESTTVSKDELNLSDDRSDKTVRAARGPLERKQGIHNAEQDASSQENPTSETQPLLQVLAALKKVNLNLSKLSDKVQSQSEILEKVTSEQASFQYWVEEQLASLNGRLTNQVLEFDARVSDQLIMLESRVTPQMPRFDTRIDGLQLGLNARIDGVEAAIENLSMHQNAKLAAIQVVRRSVEEDLRHLVVASQDLRQHEMQKASLLNSVAVGVSSLVDAKDKVVHHGQSLSLLLHQNAQGMLKLDDRMQEIKAGVPEVKDRLESVTNYADAVAKASIEAVRDQMASPLADVKMAALSAEEASAKVSANLSNLSQTLITGVRQVLKEDTTYTLGSNVREVYDISVLKNPVIASSEVSITDHDKHDATVQRVIVNASFEQRDGGYTATSPDRKMLLTDVSHIDHVVRRASSQWVEYLKSIEVNSGSFELARARISANGADDLHAVTCDNRREYRRWYKQHVTDNIKTSSRVIILLEFQRKTFAAGSSPKRMKRSFSQSGLSTEGFDFVTHQWDSSPKSAEASTLPL